MAHDLHTPHPPPRLGFRWLSGAWVPSGSSGLEAPRLGSLQRCPSQNPGPGNIRPAHIGRAQHRNRASAAWLRDWGHKTPLHTYTFKMKDEVTNSSDA